MTVGKTVFYLVVWLLLGILSQAAPVQFAWDSSGPGVGRYRLTYDGSNTVATVSNETTVVVANFPCGRPVPVFVVAIGTNNLVSDPSVTLMVVLPCPPANFRYQAILESSDAIDAPFQTMSVLGSFTLVANEPRLFYRVRLVPQL